MLPISFFEKYTQLKWNYQGTKKSIGNIENAHVIMDILYDINMIACEFKNCILSKCNQS